MAEPEVLYTPEEVAAQLRLNIQSVYRACASRRLGHYRIIHQVRIPERALHAFIERSTHARRG